jgi:hypothetical protein
VAVPLTRLIASRRLAHRAFTDEFGTADRSESGQGSEMTETEIAPERDAPTGDHSAVRSGRRGGDLIKALSLGLMIYGMVLWIYVAICALVVPDTLKLPLTHLIPFIREDTSGGLGFALSFCGFVIYRFMAGRS